MIKKKYSKEQIKKGFAYALCALLALFLLIGSFTFGASAGAEHAHLFEDGFCSTCLACENCGLFGVYKYVHIEGTNTHFKALSCPKCDLTSSALIEDCNSGGSPLTNPPCIYCGASMGDSESPTDCVFHAFSLGVCITCGYVCPHPSYTSGECDVCDLSCLSHSWSSSVCTICGYVCPHLSYTNGECNTCDFKCSHDRFFMQTDGSMTCDTCGYVCINHKYFYEYTSSNNAQYHTLKSTCSVCYFYTYDYEDPHIYNSSGVCSKCDYLCTHAFNNGVCVGCGYVCPHPSYSDGECDVCDLSCLSHSWSGALCSICGIRCTHPSYTNGECDTCDYICPHTTIKDGICDRCGYVCPHSYNDVGRCITCGYVCAHIKGFYDGACAVCGFICPHRSYTNGKCDLCSALCCHSWSGALCSICGIRCTHPSYTNGECDTCDYICPHTTIKDGICDRCGYVCPHSSLSINTNSKTYDDYFYECSVCGKRCSEDYNPYSMSPNCRPNYFHPAPFYGVMNSVDSWAIEDIGEYSSQFSHVFNRFGINEFVDDTFDNKACTLFTDGEIEKFTLSNGFDYEVSASRYLVIRLRKQYIDLIEIDIMGGVGVDDVNSYGYADYYYRGAGSIPDGEWVNIVFDLSTFMPKNKNYYAYEVGSTIDSFFLRICSLYTSSDAYIDFEYFALCDDLAQVHGATNPFNTAFNSADLGYKTYLATYYDTSLLANEHTFDGDSVCDCWYVCTHASSTVTEYINDTHCGSVTSCDVCGKELSRIDLKHSFKENGTICGNCGFECQHVYSNGVCLYCDTICIHVFNGAHCKYCWYVVDSPTESDDDLAFNLITSIYDAQANIFMSMLNYNIFGINIAMVVGALVVLAVTIFIIKKVK